MVIKTSRKDYFLFSAPVQNLERQFVGREQKGLIKLQLLYQREAKVQILVLYSQANSKALLQTLGVAASHFSPHAHLQPLAASRNFEITLLQGFKDQIRLGLHNNCGDHEIAVSLGRKKPVFFELDIDQINSFVYSIQHLIFAHPTVPQLKVKKRLQQLKLAQMCLQQEVDLQHSASFLQNPAFSEVLSQFKSLITGQIVLFLLI